MTPRSRIFNLKKFRPQKLSDDDCFYLYIFPCRARQGLMDQLLSFDAGLPLENLNLLEALTLRGADDVFDMERLEVLGQASFETSLVNTAWKDNNMQNRSVIYFYV